MTRILSYLDQLGKWLWANSLNCWRLILYTGRRDVSVLHSTCVLDPRALVARIQFSPKSYFSYLLW